MKILHVVPSFYPAYVYGGPIQSVYQLCQSLVKLGSEVRVLTTDTNGRDEVLDVEKTREIELVDGLYVRYCHRWICHSVSPTFLRLLPSYVRWADLVHLTAVYSFPTIPSLIVCKVMGKPVVWSPRGALQRWSGSTRLAVKSIWELLCRAVAPGRLLLDFTSEEEAEESLKRLPGYKAAIVPNGVEIPERLNNPGKSGVLRMLCLGRLHPKKGLENLLLALKMLDGRLPVPWSCILAGSGEEEYGRLLRSRIEELGLGEQVRMVGEVTGEAKQRLLENTDLVVVPSYTENFGLVVAEGLASGVPVIASRGTPWQKVEEVGCGLWVDNSPRDLAAAVEEISRRPLRDMGQRGREWMRRAFSWDQRAKTMAEIYKKVIAN